MGDRYLHLLGYASGLGGADPNCGKGPGYLKKSSVLQHSSIYPTIVWDAIIPPQKSKLPLEQTLSQLCTELALRVKKLLIEGNNFSVLGGDHTGAIGTWSGVASALSAYGDLGLIWIDAHMDSHTPETSPSQRMHGMPLAVLLGSGYPSLTHLFNFAPKIKPENLFLIGVRSFEEGEAVFLKSKNVKIYTMHDIAHHGLEKILHEVTTQLHARTIGYGISLDLDSIDPTEAPGVDVPEPQGIHFPELFSALAKIMQDRHLIATEIFEFDPIRDQQHKTEHIVVQLLEIMAREHHAFKLPSGVVLTL